MGQDSDQDSGEQHEEDKPSVTPPEDEPEEPEEEQPPIQDEPEEDNNQPDEDNPFFDLWDPDTWPDWNDFLNWLKDLFGGLIP